MKQFISSVLTLLAMVALSFTFAQNKLDVNNLSKDWQLYSAQSGVKIYVKAYDYDYSPNMKPVHFVLVKVENTTSKPVSMSYSAALSDGQGCINCGNSESDKSIRINAGQTIEGTPEIGALAVMVNNPNFSSPRTTQFIQLLNIKTK